VHNNEKEKTEYQEPRTDLETGTRPGVGADPLFMGALFNEEKLWTIDILYSETPSDWSESEGEADGWPSRS